MNGSWANTMFPPRATLLAVSLGSATLLGWLCLPARTGAVSACGPRSLHRTATHPTSCHPHGCPCVPARRRFLTNPDSTPDDWGDECGARVDLDDGGSDSILQGALGRTAACGPPDDPPPTWPEPARYSLLLRVTRRF